VTALADRIVIIGAGIAGVSAAGGLRAAGYSDAITLISAEAELPYRRPPLSKELLRGEKSLDQIRIKPAEWYEDQRIELRTSTTVDAIDRSAQTVTTSAGEDISYDRLILTTGGRARSFWPESPRVHTLRSAADIPALSALFAASDSVTIIGGGLIGSEVAASARAFECARTVLETAPYPLPRLLPEAIAAAYTTLHAEYGTTFETEVAVQDVSAEGATVLISAADGRQWRSDAVVVAVGMQPNTELAEAAGLNVDNGIVVNELGQSSDPQIWAAGDVANRPEPILGGRIRTEHWQSSMNHGTAVGRNAAGDAVAFEEVPWCWSDQYGTNLQIVGFPDAADDFVVRGNIETRDFTALFVRGSQLVGAVGIGRPGEVRAARAHIAASGNVEPAALMDDSNQLVELLRT
jgi:NADPH-dependent 2,4-dienoyl-CoA reductase/sulfur reductase-like enzyme